MALSGGYSRDEANERLARNPGLIASFSRALIGELSADQSDASSTRPSTPPWRASTGHRSPDLTIAIATLRVSAARQRTQGALSCVSVRSRQPVQYARYRSSDGMRGTAVLGWSRNCVTAGYLSSRLVAMLQTSARDRTAMTRSCEGL